MNSELQPKHFTSIHPISDSEMIAPSDASRAVGRSIPWLKATATTMRLPVHVTSNGRWIFPRQTVEKLRAEVERREKESLL